MQHLLTVEGLSKAYERFHLEDISFSLPPGYIMGFIGRNGAGKTVTIKSVLNLVRPDSGRVTIFGQDYAEHEVELKRAIGVALGPVEFYPTTRLAKLTDVFRRFYPAWDDGVYRSYLKRFELDETKTVKELSTGMKVKYALALALSHDAKLLILDEPTTGLDPVSRDDLLDLFREFIEPGDRSILFSTQLVSDLEACADFITYIRDGRLVASADRDEFLGSYVLVKGPKDQLQGPLEPALIGYKPTDLGFTGLIQAADAGLAADCQTSTPTIEQVMVYSERRAGTGPDNGYPSQAGVLVR